MKAHEKYVIEIEDIIWGYGNPPGQEDVLGVISQYTRIKGFNTLFFDQHGLDKLVPLEHELEVIKAEELKKAYNDGLRDGLEAAKNGAQCTETKDLRIGDEVKFMTIGGEFVRGVVLHRDPKDEEYTVLGGNGNTYYCYEAEKTGRHFDQVKEMLRDIRGE